MNAFKMRKLLLLNVLLSMMLFLGGCATMGKYSLDKYPTEDTKAFLKVEVAEVEVGITKDELEPETVAELRSAIMEAIMKKNLYQEVAAELGMEEGTLLIECKIIELDNGSQFLRWLIGAGKAYLETSCQFINKDTNTVFASGVFTGEIKGGAFGGSPDQEKMSMYVGEAVARFLKKGK